MPSISRLLLLLLATTWLSACSGSAEPNAKNAESDSAPASAETQPAGIESEPSPADGGGAQQAQGSSKKTSENEQVAAAEQERKTGTAKQLSTGYDAETERNLPKRETIEGRWIFILTQPAQGQDLHLFLVNISKQDGGELGAKILTVAANSVPGTSTIAEAKLTDKTVKLLFDMEGQQLDFEGQLDGGVIRGNFVPVGGMGCNPARMVPTELKNFSSHNLMHATLGFDETEALREADDRLVATRKFAEDNPDSPLVVPALQRLISLAEAEGYTAETVDELAKEYIEACQVWGDRFVQFGHLSVALNLTFTGYDPAVSTRYIDIAEEKVTDEGLMPMKQLLEQARTQVALAEAKRDLKSDDEQVRVQAFNKLQELHEKDPFNAEITVMLAGYAADQQMLDEAMAWYAELAALPNMEQMAQAAQQSEDGDAVLPSESLAKLWKEKHGSTEGLDEYLDEIYAKSITSFAKPPVSAEGSGTRTSLVELFTGAMCPPCVAADVATGGLETTYAPSDVIVLRYHMHIPGPDPLANPHAEARFHGYSLQGTPSIILNGRTTVPAGGGLAQAVSTYDTLSGLIENLRAESTDVRIEGNAKADASTVKLNVSVNGFPEGSEAVRLRIALAEEEIWFPASNGMRRHEMVVRWLAGGPEGISPADGKLEYVGQHDLGDLKQELSSYLAEFEKGRGYEFPVKPLELDHMKVVAWVQNNETGEILQATVIPIDGELSVPGEVEGQPADKPAKPAAAEAPPKSLESKADEPKSDEAGQSGTDAPQSEAAEPPADSDPPAEDAEPPAAPEPPAETVDETR